MEMKNEFEFVDDKDGELKSDLKLNAQFVIV